MKCNLKERALALFKKTQDKKEQTIIKDFNKRFGCEYNLNDVELKWDIVIFHFDDFDIWGNITENRPYFNFYKEHEVICGSVIEDLYDLSRLVHMYCED